MAGSKSNRLRWGVFGLCSGILIALVYRAGWGGAIGLPCGILFLTGIPCPMCGMTRSLTALLQGNVAASIAFHGLGIPMLVGLGLVLLIVSLELGFGRMLNIPGRRWLQSRSMWLMMVTILLVHHGIRLIPMSQSGELAMSISTSVLGRFLNGGG